MLWDLTQHCRNWTFRCGESKIAVGVNLLVKSHCNIIATRLWFFAMQYKGKMVPVVLRFKQLLQLEWGKLFGDVWPHGFYLTCQLSGLLSNFNAWAFAWTHFCRASFSSQLCPRLSLKLFLRTRDCRRAGWPYIGDDEYIGVFHPWISRISRWTFKPVPSRASRIRCLSRSEMCSQLPLSVVHLWYLCLFPAGKWCLQGSCCSLSNQSKLNQAGFVSPWACPSSYCSPPCMMSHLPKLCQFTRILLQRHWQDQICRGLMQNRQDPSSVKQATYLSAFAYHFVCCASLFVAVLFIYQSTQELRKSDIVQRAGGTEKKAVLQTVYQLFQTVPLFDLVRLTWMTPFCCTWLKSPWK